MLGSKYLNCLKNNLKVRHHQKVSQFIILLIISNITFIVVFFANFNRMLLQLLQRTSVC